MALSTEIQAQIDNHKLWLETDGREGAIAFLRGAFLRGADLTGADLRGAFLRGADLRDAFLGGADLTGAFLTGADLRGADLRGADLRGADLRGAFLTGADLDRAQIETAVIDWQLIDPDPTLPAQILEQVKQRPDSFDMSIWHGENECGTTHCLAGWAETLDPRGAELAKKFGHHIAGSLLLPGAEKIFYQSEKNAIEWLETQVAINAS